MRQRVWSSSPCRQHGLSTTIAGYLSSGHGVVQRTCQAASTPLLSAECAMDQLASPALDRPIVAGEPQSRSNGVDKSKGARAADVRLDRDEVRLPQPLTQLEHRSILADLHDAAAAPGFRTHPGLLHRHGGPGSGDDLLPVDVADHRHGLLPRDACPGPRQGGESEGEFADHAHRERCPAAAVAERHIRDRERGIRPVRNVGDTARGVDEPICVTRPG